MDQAGIDGEPGAADQTLLNAALHHALKDQAKQIAVAELGPCRYFEKVE